MKSERYYPLIHFAAEYGWINDPNGLVFHDGIYELYFQHNPDGIEWGNMTWGHARSADLIHWEELEPVLQPDANGMMFSGCGMRNDREALGLPKNALIFYYTAALCSRSDQEKAHFTIRYAYSTDGGSTLVKTGEPVLESVYPENRDPKVFWHEESGAYIMVLWLNENDFGIFRSEDMEHFVLSQSLTLEGGYECPDLFLLPVCDEKTQECTERKWVFWTADGTYFVGSFDGYRFTPEQAGQKAYARKGLPYAAQTFSGMDERISIAWLHTKCVGLQTTGVMSLPRELTLVRKGGIFSLRQKLPEIVEKAAIRVGEMKSQGDSLGLDENAAVRMLICSQEDWRICFTSPDEQEQFLVSFQYHRGSFHLTYREESTDMPFEKDCSQVELIFDRGILEISSYGGTVLLVNDMAELRMIRWEKVTLQDGDARIIVEGIS